MSSVNPDPVQVPQVEAPQGEPPAAHGARPVAPPRPLCRPLTVGDLGRLVIDHNPCYLLSGLLLLVGCYLISSAVYADPDQFGKLAALLAVFNVYEFLVIGLGVHLAHKGRELLRDAGYLLVLELFLLLDITLVNNELFTARYGWGGLIALAGAVLALVKVGLILRGLGWQLSRAAWIVLGTDLTLVYGLPGLFKVLGQHELIGPHGMYLAWWLAGGLMALRAVSANGLTPRPGRAAESLGLLPRILGKILRTAPPASAMVHLYAAGYAYHVDWQGAYLSPILLGCALWLVLQTRAQARIPAVRRVSLLLMILAALLSLAYEPNLVTGVPIHGQLLMLSPFRWTLAAVGPMLVGVWWRTGGWGLWVEVALSWLLAGLGHDPVAIRYRLEWMWDRCLEMVSHMVPRTTLMWGIAAIVTAFAMLAAGASVSLWKHARRERLAGP